MPAKGRLRKRQIIETAKEMFLRQGFQSTHIGEICENLNITRGTVYQYFGNKREILYAILENIEENFNDIFDIDDIDEFISESPSFDEIYEFQVDRFSKAIASILKESITIQLFFNEIIGLDEEVINHINQFKEYLVKILTKDFSYLTVKGIYCDDFDPKMTSASLIGGIFFILQEHDHKNRQASPSEIAETIFKNLHESIMPIHSS